MANPGSVSQSGGCLKSLYVTFIFSTLGGDDRIWGAAGCMHIYIYILYIIFNLLKPFTVVVYLIPWQITCLYHGHFACTVT